MHAPKKVVAPILAVVILAIVSIWYFGQGARAASLGSLEASGTVETVEVLVSTELSGKVAEVLVQDGEMVEPGTRLFRLDDELLQAQRQRAVTALQAAQDGQITAQAGLQAAMAALNLAKVNAEATQASAEAELVPLQQSLDDLYDNLDSAKTLAEREVAAANRNVRETTYLLDNFTVPTLQQKMTALEAVAAMKTRLDKARQNFEPYKYESSGDSTREKFKDALDEAQSDYDAAVRRLEYETAVGQAQARLDKALRDLKDLEDGPDPDQVRMFEARIEAVKVAPKQAEAAVAQAEVNVIQAQAKLDQANTAVDQAQAELSLIDVQIDKLTVTSVVAGTVLARSIEPGEVIQPGATALTLGQLDDLTITVYLPEDRYGEIHLGMKAKVTVDSFPGASFEAEVTRIADRAEYTPRNVQTEEGRRTTVFAVELKVKDSEGRLKPGMPADVKFLQ